MQGAARRALVWADAGMNRLYGWRHNPIYHSGALATALLLVLIVTGIYLLIFYRIGSPYASMARIDAQVWAGRWIRTLHRYAADAALLAAAVHALRMFAQNKSWGPRVLAWVSGLFLVFFFFVCGWTGYVLVWDTQALVLARAGARLLDVLPLFSEPLGRTFVGERPLPDAFFFINLFLHAALPIGVGLLLWMHVARVARPALLPPRALTRGVTGLLLAASVLWPVGLAPEAELFRLPAVAPYDFFYAFWLPAAAAVPVGAVWAAFAATVLGLLLVPRLTRPRAAVPAPSVVDERACTGCEQCYHDCPYEAISMVPRSDQRTTLVARVDPALCVSCGICAGSCAPMVVGPPGRSGRAQLEGVRARLAERRPGPRDVVLIGCTRAAAREVDEAAPSLRGAVIRHPVSCVGSLHTAVIEQYLRAGAAGVLVVSCPERDCWNREGAKWARQRMAGEREAELKERVDRRRVHLVYAAEAEGAALRAELDAFRRRLAVLGLASAADDVDLRALCDRAEAAG